MVVYALLSDAKLAAAIATGVHHVRMVSLGSDIAG